MADGRSVPPFLQTSYPRLAIACRICRACCDAHDRAYYEGVDGDEAARLAADTALRDCMQRLCDAGAVDPATGQPLDEQSVDDFFWAVHHFGGPHWGTGRAWDGRLLWEQQRIESP
jgi:hypothetical protein